MQFKGLERERAVNMTTLGDRLPLSPWAQLGLGGFPDGVGTIDEFAKYLSNLLGVHSSPTNASDFWFRGERERYELPLLPRIAHQLDDIDKGTLDVRPFVEGSEMRAVEVSAIEEFKAGRKGRQLAASFGLSPSALDWLPLARHHQIATRLLDVTTNALVALYFACWNPDSGTKDPWDSTLPGFVYLIRKDGYRQQTVSRSSVQRPTGRIGDDVQDGLPNTYLELYEPWLLRPTQHVQTFFRPQVDHLGLNARMANQAGGFIWWRYWDDHSKPVGAPTMQLDVPVKAPAKPTILRQLGALGIEPGTLLPDEEGKRWQRGLTEALERAKR